MKKQKLFDQDFWSCKLQFATNLDIHVSFLFIKVQSCGALNLNKYAHTRIYQKLTTQSPHTPHTFIPEKFATFQVCTPQTTNQNAKLKQFSDQKTWSLHKSTDLTNGINYSKQSRNYSKRGPLKSTFTTGTGTLSTPLE